MTNNLRRSSPTGAGFSVVELLLVLAITLVVAAIAIPNALNAVRAAKFRGAAADFSGLLQSARIYAIRDNRFYSTYVLAPTGNQPQEAYVDMLPKGTTGSSGNGGAFVAPGDPIVTIPAEITEQPAASAPSTANLQAQLLPSNTPVIPTDATIKPITFGPRGLPCAVVQLTGASVCNSLGGPTAYWAFFFDNTTNQWEAVTVTPAGRVKKWSYSGTAWSEM